MKNILSSKVVVSGARKHWTGDHDGTVVTPKIEIEGLDANGQMYGQITADISRSTTDGGATVSLWSMFFPFGRFLDYANDSAKFVGHDGETYNELWYLKNAGTTLKEVVLEPAVIPNNWEIVEEEPRYGGHYSNHQEACEAAGFSPKRYTITFKGFPTLEQIDQKWSKMLEMGAKCLEVIDDVVIVVTNKRESIPFDSI